MNLKDKIQLKILLKMTRFSKPNEKIIGICERYPKDEKLLMIKITSLKVLKKDYKTLECVHELAKLNPYNPQVLKIISKYS